MIVLVPLRVTVFTPAPTKLPWRTSIRRDAHLHLLDRLERDRRDAGAVARLAAEAERVVEVRAVDRDVVRPVVLARRRCPMPPYCGVRRVMSLMRPEIVGSERQLFAR
mgnify:CR=1 FL=1